MASSGKRKTTMAKLQRETKLRERRAEKETRKQIRKASALAPLDPNQEGEFFDSPEDEFSEPPDADVASSDEASRAEL